MGKRCGQGCTIQEWIRLTLQLVMKRKGSSVMEWLILKELGLSFELVEKSRPCRKRAEKK